MSAPREPSGAPRVKRARNGGPGPKAGVPFYWLIDLEQRAVEALALRDGVWVGLAVFDDTATARIAPFEAIELETGSLFLP